MTLFRLRGKLVWWLSLGGLLCLTFTLFLIRLQHTTTTRSEHVTRHVLTPKITRIVTTPSTLSPSSPSLSSVSSSSPSLSSLSLSSLSINVTKQTIVVLDSALLRIDKSPLWLQLWSENTTLLWGKTAYIDTRKQLYLESPVIVTFGYRETRVERLQKSFRWFCHLSYADGSSSCVSEVIIFPVEYQFANNHGWSVPSYYLCPYKIRRTHPIAISLSSHSCTSKQVTPWAPIINTKNSRKTLKTIGICLHKALFNITDPQLVIQFIETHKLFGAELFTIYIQEVSESVRDVLYSYSQEGLVDVVEWKVNISMDVRDYGQVALIHECLYRNMHRVKYLGFLDIDELFVPNPQIKSLTNLLYSVDNPMYGSFRFMHVFLHEGPLNEVHLQQHQLRCPRVTVPVYFKRYLRTNHLESRNIYDSLGSKTKVFVKPHAIVKMGRHSLKLRPIHKLVRGFTEYMIPGEKGLLHHYREIIKVRDEVNNKRYEKRPLVLDFTLKNYQERLMDILNSKLCVSR